MNLTKLFNFKYFLQNLKKSKGLVILLTIVVPMLTSIMLLTIDNKYVMPFWELSIINIIGMYIIPIVLSMTLFSYVYKKNSVDFIGAMPLSRKTIFLTNTIGGIAIIIIMQLITMISTLFLSQIISELVIFGSMVWDIFVFYTIAYIFVFTVSNLAMSFSGNKFSQLVAICLILFTIPFIAMSCDVLGDDFSYINLEEKIAYSTREDTSKITIDTPQYFTAPSYIFGIQTGAKYKYSTESVIKMLVLSVIYVIIGLILFEKKKLEMAGESYESKITHLVIKMLTFIPFMFVYCSLNNSDKVSVFLFFVAILAVYYFVFDLITNKKIKIKISIPAFIISWVVIFAIYEGVIPKFGRNNIDIINIDDVKSVYIDSVKYNSYSRCNFGLLVEDKELINLILTETRDRYPESYYMYDKEIEYVIDETVVESIDVENKEKYEYINRDTNMYFVITLKNGKKYEYSMCLDYNICKTIIMKLGDKKVIKNFNNYVPLSDEMNFSKQDEKEIIEILNREFSDLTYKELYEIYNGTLAGYNLKLYEYKNHELIRNDFAYRNFEELYRFMIQKANDKTKNVLYEISNFYTNSNIIELVEEKNPGIIDENTENEKYIGDLEYEIVYISTNEIKDFIKQDINNDFDINKEYIVIKSNYPTCYYTNDLDEFYNALAKSWNKQYGNIIKLNENV